MGLAKLVKLGVLTAEEARRLMVDKGKRKYAAKKDIMISHYRGAKDEAVENYRILFPAALAEAYEAAWGAMPGNYEAIMRKPVEEAWAKEFAKAIGLA